MTKSWRFAPGQRQIDPKHISKLCQKYITSKREQLVLTGTLTDFNPIEQVWDELDRKIRPKQPTSVALFWQLFHEN